MKRLISISLIASTAFGLLWYSAFSDNQIQLHGKLIAAENDTVSITVWSNGELIGQELQEGVFYEMVLGEHPHYTIEFVSGSQVKYCTLICHFMEFESIPVDIDFRSNQNIIIYKKRKNSKAYIVVYYGSGATREQIIKPYETE